MSSIRFTDQPRVWFIPDAINPEAPTAAEIEAGREITDLLHLPPLEQMWAHGEAVIDIDGREFPVTVGYPVIGSVEIVFRIAPPPPEPTASADRTRSPRWRAGSRRTKRLARCS